MKNPCIKDDENNCLLKVGVSDSPTTRTKTMGTNPEPFQIMFAKYMKNPYEKESQIKNMFKDFRYKNSEFYYSTVEKQLRSLFEFNDGRWYDPSFTRMTCVKKKHARRIIETPWKTQGTQTNRATVDVEGHVDKGTVIYHSVEWDKQQEINIREANKHIYSKIYLEARPKKKTKYKHPNGKKVPHLRAFMKKTGVHY
tara:strand:- start:175 stop:765 length:591 start_codon:yes stop_codon:yes gene_type:complete